MIPLVWLDKGGDHSNVTLLESTCLRSTFLGGPLGAKVDKRIKAGLGLTRPDDKATLHGKSYHCICNLIDIISRTRYYQPACFVSKYNFNF